MQFGGFLGNEPLKARLRASFDAGKTSHCYLISGPAGSGKRTLARLLSAALECEGGGQRPCLACRACRKVLSGAHPDVAVVDDPEKKQVPVDCIRQARSDAFIRPNEGRRKIFVIPRAQDMNESAQNALLKILEEPPEYGVFLLLAENPDALLPTVRSRCAELHLAPLDQQTLLRAARARFPDRPEEELQAAAARSGGFLGQALASLGSSGALLPQTEQFAKVFAGKDALGLLELLCSMERWKRAQAAEALTQWLQLTAGALRAREGLSCADPLSRSVAERRTPGELLRAAGLLRQAISDCWANVSVANICAGLAVLLR